MKLIWSPQSLEDRKQIYGFICELDPDAAETLDAMVEMQAQKLLDHPAMGRPGRV